jgi:hypothetical protein
VRSLESYVHREVPAWFGGGVRGKRSSQPGGHLAAHPILYKALRRYRGCPWNLSNIVAAAQVLLHHENHRTT